VPDPSTPTAADLIAELRAYGLSVSEIARELGRSPRMIRKVVQGQSSGQLYVPALNELVQTGRTQAPPERRRGRDGELVRVRAPRGATEPTRRPQEDTGAAPAGGAGQPPTAPTGRRGRSSVQSEPARQPGTFSDSTTYLPGGVRQHTVTAPRSEGTGREKARQGLLGALRRAARSQQAGRKNVRFRVTLQNGTTVEVGAKGGYAVSKALARSRSEGDDPFAWLSGELTDRQYLQDTLSRENRRIIGVEATIY
jgi:transcriptional regulator with XRE-family HTH domain